MLLNALEKVQYMLETWRKTVLKIEISNGINITYGINGVECEGSIINECKIRIRHDLCTQLFSAQIYDHTDDTGLCFLTLRKKKKNHL